MCLLLAAPIASERLMGIEETYYGICIQCDKAVHLSKKLLLPVLLDGMLYKPDPQKNDCRPCQMKVRWSFVVPAARKNCQTFCRTQKKETDELCHYKAEQIFKYPALWKNMLDTIGL